MRRLLTVATVLGLTGVVSSMLLLVGARVWLNIDIVQIQTLIFLKLAVAGHLTLFVARTHRAFYSKPYPAPIMVWSALGTKALATLVAGFGFGLITPVPWWAIAATWGYGIAWMIILDRVNVEVYRHLDLTAPRHRRSWSVSTPPFILQPGHSQRAPGCTSALAPAGAASQDDRLVAITQIAVTVA